MSRKSTANDNGTRSPVGSYREGQGILANRERIAETSIQRRADFLIETLKESTDAELRQFFVDLGDWVFSDEKVLTMFNANLLDLFFSEMQERA